MIKLSTLFLLIPSIALADVSVGFGYTKFSRAPDGNWYQGQYGHDINATSPSGTVRYDSGKYSVGYIYTGKVTTNALAKSSDVAIGNNSPWPMSSYYGTGKSEGIFASRRFGDQYYITTGAMLYRSTWDCLVPDYRDSLNPPIDTQYSEPRTVNLHHHPSWMVLPLVGFGYRATNSIAVELNFIPTKTYGGEYPAFYRGYATNLTIVKTIK